MDAQDWNIKSRSDHCRHTQKTFEDGETFITELVWGPEGYERRDWSTPAYEAEGPSEGVVSTWKSVFRVPPPKAEEPLKKETAEGLLRKLLETEEDTRTHAIFVLAVMLERKRILKEQSAERRDDDTLIRFYEHKDTGETFIITDPELSLSNLQDVQEEVVILLGGKPPTQTPAEPSGLEDNDEDEDDEDDEDDD